MNTVCEHPQDQHRNSLTAVYEMDWILKLPELIRERRLTRAVVARGAAP
jgi:hypothetical protein